MSPYLQNLVTADGLDSNSTSMEYILLGFRRSAANVFAVRMIGGNFRFFIH